MSVRISEEIPSEPPSDPQERERLQWMMQREAYRIARWQEGMTRTAKIAMMALLGLLSLVGGAISAWDTFWSWVGRHVHS